MNPQESTMVCRYVAYAKCTMPTVKAEFGNERADREQDEACSVVK